MLKILFMDGSEKECKGIVKQYKNSQSIQCPYDFEIEGIKIRNTDNLKLVYDNITDEFIYFNSCSYGFYKGKDKYDGFYKRSLRDIKLIKKFKKHFEPFMQHIDFNNLNNLANCLVFCENEITNIFKRNI